MIRIIKLRKKLFFLHKEWEDFRYWCQDQSSTTELLSNLFFLMRNLDLVYEERRLQLLYSTVKAEWNALFFHAKSRSEQYLFSIYILWIHSCILDLAVADIATRVILVATRVIDCAVVKEAK